ncbi:carbohydrate kinase family protein [Chitinophaga sancti]|uniref:Carbohydrate kinase n=1 Tax=Chitinophaga sancti TaxID=1004 RepID=A0A1K1RUW7_9BACT|nr:carbohydrate kinase [Chitinophaga sancti]WQG92058.1 carbohydrate kinase [Chitinophaga sancti]SFW75620.1 fructokinase [Chitinophaga sancti]
MDTSNRYPVVCFGETLWDLLPNGRQAGGAPMNVAYHLQQLGKTPAVISRIGFDELGKQLIETLEAKKINTEFFQMDEVKPTSVVTAEIRGGHEVVYNIVEDVAWDYIACNAELEALVAQARHFVFGTLSTRSKTTRDTLFQLLPFARNKVLDINLRPPFYNRNIIETLLSAATMVKMNKAELELITGWFSPLSNEIDRIKILKERFEIDTIVVTCGGDGAIFNHGAEYVTCEGISVPVADTVGSGDAFLAGIIAKMSEGAPLRDTLAFANQLAAFVTTQKGACSDYQLSAIYRLPVLNASV